VKHRHRVPVPIVLLPVPSLAHRRDVVPQTCEEAAVLVLVLELYQFALFFPQIDLSLLQLRLVFGVFSLRRLQLDYDLLADPPQLLDRVSASQGFGVEHFVGVLVESQRPTPRRRSNRISSSLLHLRELVVQLRRDLGDFTVFLAFLLLLLLLNLNQVLQVLDSSVSQFESVRPVLVLDDLAAHHRHLTVLLVESLVRVRL